MKKVILFFVFQLFFSQFVFSGSIFALEHLKQDFLCGVDESPLYLLSLDEDEILDSRLFIPPEFEILRVLSEKNSLSFKEGIEAMVRLPHTIPMRDVYSPDDFVEKWQFLYNRVHNRLHIHSQAARLRQEIPHLGQEVSHLRQEVSRLRFGQEGFFSRKNEEERRMVLEERRMVLEEKAEVWALKQYQLQTYEQLLNDGVPGERLLDYKPSSCKGFCSTGYIAPSSKATVFKGTSHTESYAPPKATSSSKGTSHIESYALSKATAGFKGTSHIELYAPPKAAAEIILRIFEESYSEIQDAREEIYKENREKEERVRDLQLVVSYIESLPEDVRTPEQRLELEWALEALWANNLSLEGDSVWDWMKGLDESYTSPFSPGILLADLSPLTSKIREFGELYHAQRVFRTRESGENDFNAQRLIRFLGLSQEVFSNSDRLFGSLIQTSSLAAGLVLEEQKTQTLSTPEPNLLFDSLMQISSVVADLFLEEQETQETQILSTPEQQFLSKLGIQEMNPQGEFADLSHLYGAVEDQGWTSACVGFSVAHDIQFELNQKGEMKQDEFISPFSVYGALHAYSKGDQPEHCLTYANANPSYDLNYDGIMNEGIDGHVLDQALDGLSSEGVCVTRDEYSRSHAQTFTYASSKVRVKDYQTYGQRISFELLRVLIENNKPPILLLSTDKKTVREDWEEMEPACGSMGHSVIVVGYGMDEINPFTLNREPYLIVRDSLNYRRIHYKVRAENLLEFTTGLIKITDVELIKVTEVERV